MALVISKKAWGTAKITGQKVEYKGRKPHNASDAIRMKKRKKIVSAKRASILK